MKKITQHIKYALLLLVFAGGISATSLQAQTSICVGEDIILNLTGYTGTIQWKFSQLGVGGPFNNLPGGVGDSVAFTPTITTWFFAEVTNGDCDPFHSDTIEVALSVPPTADAGGNQAICEGDVVTIGGSPAGSGGVAPLSYSWTPTAGLTSSTDENPMASPTVTTEYVLAVTDANGCIGWDSVMVLVNPAPIANAGDDTTVTCGATLTLNGSASGTGPFTYAWSPAASLSSPTVQNPTATPGGPTTYTLTVTDANGCTGVDSVNIGTSGGGVSGSDTIMYTGGIVNYTVPSSCTGVITFEVWGAEGGFGSASNIQPGLGAYQKGDFSIAAGTQLQVLVGQRPVSGNGGGGGSFVVNVSSTPPAPVIIAGGGGGGAQTTDDNNKQGQAGTSGATGGAGGGLGGTNGSGGNIGTTGFQSGAGGGLLTNGTNGWTTNTGGLAFVNGGSGGTTGGAPGGFGGGGSGSGYVVGGGGGGYSGGGSGGNNPAGVGGGGGSFNNGANPTSTSGIRAGNGMIIITY